MTNSDDTFAGALVTALAAQGAGVVFGYPGESTLPFYAATRQSGMQHVMAQCERCAGYMADGYARAVDRPGFCDSPGGVGSPYLVPALHEAYNSSIPMVVLLTSSPDENVGRWPTTQIDHNGVFGAVAKAVLPLRLQHRLHETVQRAVHLATSARPGPVVIDVEPGLLSGLADDRLHQGLALPVPSVPPRAAREVTARVAALLRRSQRPLLVLGGGAHLRHNYNAIASFIDATQVAVATTFNGMGAVSSSCRSLLGVVGAKGEPEANAAAATSDLVLWMGSKGGDKSTQYGLLPPLYATVVQVDVDPEALGRTFRIDEGVVADIPSFLTDLTGELRGWAAPSWAPHRTGPTAKAPSDDPLTGAEIGRRLRAVTAPEIRIVADASRVSSWLGAYDRALISGRFAWAPRGSGMLGYALPAAIGACIGTAGPAIAFVGDGGLSMSCHEIITAVRLEIDLAIVVVADRQLGLLESVGRHLHGDSFMLPGGPVAAWDEVARAMGATAAVVETIGELDSELSAWMRRGGVHLIEARTGVAEQSPDLAMFVAGGATRW